MRVLLADMTAMLASIVSAAIDDVRDLAIAELSVPGGDLADQIRQTRTDVLILQSLHADRPLEVGPLLEDFPQLKILAITWDGREGFLHELQPHVTRVGEISAKSLAEALVGRAASRLH